ncbi:MAG: family 43 glycosylhydrolase [Bacteroidales bacterium]|nr:family 43 glycosylhydrolase [Bacteroidales bacterium]
MKDFCKLFLFVGLLFTAFSIKAQNTFKNPILTGMNPDPSICRVGDDYYLATSTFEYFPGIPIYQSKDLVHWKIVGYALSRASNNPLMGATSGTGGQYAPTLRYHDGTFYVICTNYGGQGSQGVFYVTASNPAGPWSDPHWLKNWYVDPSLMFENDSTYYLSPDNNGSFLGGTLNTATDKYFTPLRKIAAGLGGASPEGPHMYKINNYYYLMSAEGGTGYQHREVIQRSTSPYGPFQASPINPVVSHMNAPSNPFQAIGHADLVQLPDSSWWLVCLGFRPKNGEYHHLGRETFLAPLTWNADGWPKVGSNGIVQEEYPVPNLPEYIWDAETVRDNFDSTELRLAWNFVRNPHAADWSLSDKPGYLSLKGSKISFKEKDSPAFICRRQTAFNIAASCNINFVPISTNEEAGLVVRGNDSNHYDLLITLFNGKRMAVLRKYLLDKVVSLSYKEIPVGEIILRISSDDKEYKFWVQEVGKTASLMGTARTRDLSTEVIGGFTGTFIGMYASGNGTPCNNSAEFDWFDFEEDPATPYEWSIGPKDSINQMIAPEIVSIKSSKYDRAELIWNRVENATSYLIEKFTDNKFDSIAMSPINDTAFTDTGLTGDSMYLYRIRAKNDSGYSEPSIAVSVITLAKPGPYLGSPSQIPGKIEAENYDIGQNNESYFDTDDINSGGKYRTDWVDIGECQDPTAGYNVGWISTGEWLNYTMNVNDTLVNIELRVASSYGGSIKLALDGKEIARTNIATTGGWDVWKTLTIPGIKIDTGQNKILKVSFLSAGFNLNWINFVKAAPLAVENPVSEELSVYPNPANSWFRINPATADYSEVKIYSILGELVKNEAFSPEKIINISDLSHGIYFVKIKIDGDKSWNLKLLKN